MECIFCKIINKEIPADIVFENKNLIIFKDIEPKAPVHLLVVPKKHIESVNVLEEEDKEIIADVFLQAKNIAKEQNFGEGGYRIIVNTGEQSGQEVMHIHWHILGGRKLKGLG